MASQSTIHKTNKAQRLKSTKRWDSLNKSYCWQQATPWVCVCTYVKRLLDTFPHREKVLVEDIHIICLNHIHHTTEVKPISPSSPFALSWSNLSCESVCLLPVHLCVCERDTVHESILSDLWRRPRSGQKGKKWRKTVTHYVPARVSFVFPTMHLRWQIEGVDIFTLPSSSPCFAIESGCHPGISRGGPTLLSNVNILLLRTRTTHYTRSFPLNGNRRIKTWGSVPCVTFGDCFQTFNWLIRDSCQIGENNGCLHIVFLAVTLSRHEYLCVNLLGTSMGHVTKSDITLCECTLESYTNNPLHNTQVKEETVRREDQVRWKDKHKGQLYSFWLTFPSDQWQLSKS